MNVDEVLGLDPGPERTAALAACLQGCFETTEVPVLVGGAAVELYSGGAHTTGDLDFVGEVPGRVARQLEQAGFERRGRHWIHEGAQVFLEFAGVELGAGERTIWIRVRGHRLRMISVEDLLVDRLLAWEHWRSPVDGANAFHVFRSQRRRIKQGRLTRRARIAGVPAALQSLRQFVKRFKRRAPPREALDAWANSTR